MLSKCVEVWEQMQQRMGVALVGPPGVGKSTILRLLRHAVSKLGTAVQVRTLNPKAMPRAELLGHVDVDTRQWTEGVLTSCAAQLAALPNDVRAWLICDGDVDPEWVESLNSVLDDNRLLTLPSGWRIQFGPNVNFLFETADLVYASPATVSRMGTIFLSEEAVDSKTMVKSWLKEQPEHVGDFLAGYLDYVLPPCLDLVLRSNGLAVPYSPLALTRSALSLLQDATSKPQLASGLIHGLGANLDLNTRQQLAQKVLEVTGEYVPSPDRILDCYYNPDRKRLDLYSNDMADHSAGPLVLTAAARRSAATLDCWLALQQPVLVCGPQGSGKGVLLRHCLEKLANAEVAVIYCSALTCPQHVLYKLRQVCVASASPTGRLYRPKTANQLVLYLKGLELAQPDQYGTNMLTAWLQQLFAHGGFHDTDLEWATLDRVQVVASLDAQGHKPSLRMTSHMLIYNFIGPNIADLKLILAPQMKLLTDSFNLPSSTRSAAVLDTILTIFKQISARFTTSQHRHYCFSPRDLTRWFQGVRRHAAEATDPIKTLLFAFTYEGLRIFCDRLVGQKDGEDIVSIFKTVMGSDWSAGDTVVEARDAFVVSIAGRPGLERLSCEEWTELVRKGDVIARGSESDLIVTGEVLHMASAVSRAVSAPAGNILLLGRPGVGRKSAARAVASMHNARMVTLHMTQHYSTKNFKADLKGALQTAGVEGQPVHLLLEDVEITDPLFLQMVANLISSGEVLGLYNAEEMEAMVAPLTDVSARDGYSGPVTAYFSERVLANLHVVLVMDFEEDTFAQLMEKSPSLYTKCEVVWLADWSETTLLQIPRLLLGTLPEAVTLAPHFATVSQGLDDVSATPRRYLAFVRLFARIYESKRKEIVQLTTVLHAGVSKLTDAQVVVDRLQRQAAEQEEKLAEKQAKAATALDQIGETMKNANVHKGEMEKLKDQTESKSKTLKERKKEIELELAEVEPLIEEARQAVGNIKNESLSEIRSLRAPPDVIRDILEGVLRLMGIQDTSWNSMKTFLAKRGVKEEIRTFDAHHISKASREAAEALLSSRPDSFDPRVAKRASVAAAPLAAWVQANVQYARVVEKIRPLEREQANLEENLASAEAQVGKLSTGLSEVDERVAELKVQLNTYTREAAVIEVGLTRERETMAAAQELVTKLEGEYARWREQLTQLSANLKDLPKDVFLASAFITYLGGQTLAAREAALEKWKGLMQRSEFDLLGLLSSEREKSRLAAEGLPVDRQSVESSVVLLNSWLCPRLVDPDGEATEWLSRHSGESVEVVSQGSPRFGRTLELAVRFGKVLLVTDVRKVHPLLAPLLRRSILTQGTRSVVRLGDSVLDYNQDFRLFLITRDTNSTPCFDATTVDFTTTQPGLAGQLLTAAIDQERPDLGSQRSNILKNKEELQAKLLDLQHALLTELGTAQGDILQNAELLHSLNETKASSEEISSALEKSAVLEVQLNIECATYTPITDFAADVYFALTPLSQISNMYRYSVQAFKDIVLNSLKQEADSFETQKKIFIKMIFQYVSRSLFKVNRLTFGMQLARRCFKNVGTAQEWEVLLGDVIPSSNTASLPEWMDEDREQDVATLRDALPALYTSLHVTDGQWRDFARAAHCEDRIPDAVRPVLSPLQTILVVQAFRPDRLHAVMTHFVCRLLGVSSLTPNSARVPQVHQESKSKEPILLVSGAGADPSEEVRNVAEALGVSLIEVSLGQGQATTALALLTNSAAGGSWLLLKNCHLMPDWMAELEEAWREFKPPDTFRLWLTTEPHQRFPPVIARTSLKLSYEAPPGVKKNLQRTYAAWPPELLRGRGPLFGRLLFAAAWFHAVVQERRTFIPQGWSKFYEITDADLSAAKDVLQRVLPSGLCNKCNALYTMGSLLQAGLGV